MGTPISAQLQAPSGDARPARLNARAYFDEPLRQPKSFVRM